MWAQTRQARAGCGGGAHSVSLAPTMVRASATAAAWATVSRTQSAAFRQLTVSRLPMTEPGAVLTCVGSWVLPSELMLISGAAFSVLTLHAQDMSVRLQQVGGEFTKMLAKYLSTSSAALCDCGAHPLQSNPGTPDEPCPCLTTMLTHLYLAITGKH